MRNRELERTVTTKQIYFWNAFGSICNAASTVLLLLAVTRILGPVQGGIFSITMAIAQQMLTISNFETATYQVTDGRNVFPFGIYMSTRVVLFLLSMIIAVVICVPKYDAYKVGVALMMCIFKGSDAFGSTFFAVFQKNGRLDIGGKSLAYRVIGASILFVIGMLAFHDLLIGSAAAALFSVIWVIFYDLRYTKCFEKLTLNWDVSKMARLIWECVPLFLGTFIMTYICNQPKYAIDSMLSEEMQNNFGIIFMPSAAINLLGIFIYRPILTKMTDQWNDRNIGDFLKSILKVTGVIVGLLLGCLGVAYFLGIPVLSFVYGVDLSAYRSALLITLLGGGMYAIAMLIYNAIVIIRQQKLIMISYALGYVMSLVITKPLVGKWELFGASLSYFISMTTLFLIMLIIFGLCVWGMQKRTKRAS